MTAQGSHRTDDGAQEPVGDLVQRASRQLSQLVRDEMRLAQAEMTEKGRRFGKGGGLFGGAGVLGVLTLQALAATAIAALSLAMDVWAAALIVTGVLAAVTAVTAALGKKQFSKAAPPTPERTVDSVKADVAAIKESAHR
ncbi:phage holin family protein [Streptomyces sp. WI04-05B]|uniref:phage holin family protein n=1 Tax=Streptomyces TaxID=1883 RepID=UPI0029A037F9|nr:MULTISPECIES: phage holin family protein [unclassified Streptomyces]MDX2548750.1 phage holin family protein [Streptomyces sp. WI04-05B]MDX2590427.1 phage holin family protein [Streptomyces sp. WI04-05A]MDX3747527.1 phage holin family protein [Streptomyces sp. AK08-02]